MNDQLSTHFEDQIRAAMKVPLPRPDFVEALAKQLRQSASVASRETRKVWHPARAISLALLFLIIASVLIIGPQRVLAQVLDWLGYVPGVGFVNQEDGLRVLETPVSQTRDGITVTIEEGLIDAEHTWLTFFFEGIRRELKPRFENEPGCGVGPEIRLPDGTLLTLAGGSGGGGPTWMREQVSYPAQPADMNEVTVHVPCVPEVMPGAGPEDWEFTVRFVPAPEGFVVLPVVTLPTETRAPDGEPLSSEMHGIQLEVQELVELNDEFLFRGTLSWERSLYTWIEFGGFQLEMRDAYGNPVAIEEVYDDSVQPSSEHSIPWSVRTDRKDISGPISIGLSQLAVQEPSLDLESVAFTLDFNGAKQQSWSLNQMIAVQGYEIIVQNATFEPWGDGTYALTLNLLTPPNEISIISLRDLDNQSKMLSGGGGGEPGAENFIQTIFYDYLPQGEHRFVVETFFHLLQGPWTVTVDIPENMYPSATPTPLVCLTQESWQEVLEAGQLPSVALEGHVLLEDRGVPALLPAQVLVSLDSNETTAIGQGSWAALSPGGRKVAYAYEGLRVLDTETGQTVLLIAEDSSYAMSWSPEGERITFIRGGDGVYLINADGSELHRAPGTSADMIGIAGWLPDGKRFVVSRIAAGGTLMQTLDLRTGETEDLFLVDNPKGGFAHLSPDGTRIIFSAGVFGKTNYGIYMANLDGSDQRLLAEPGDDFIFTMGAWSPDGQWLILNPFDNASYEPSPQHPVALNIENCQAIVLDQLLGEVTGWGP